MSAPEPKRPKSFDEESELVVVVGARWRPLRDLYHLLIKKPWWATVGLIVLNFVLSNLLFAVLYAAIGGVHGARPGSVLDAFFFSVQTMGTVGYGAMYPESVGAQSLAVVEVLIGMLLTALATGLVFTKFSTPRPRVFFTKRAVVTPFDGVPTLMVRIGDERGDHVLDARMRMVVQRTERTLEGETFYRSRELKLVRDHAISFRRGATVMHRIDADSPLHGYTPESLAADDSEIIVSILGMDGTTSQPVHAGTSYLAEEILFGYRMADTVKELPDGRIQLDLAQFDQVVEGTPTPEFPWPKKATS